MQSNLSTVVGLLSKFSQQDLTQTLSKIEKTIRGVTAETCHSFLTEAGAERKALSEAAELKRLAGQINVTIHALGILLCLPRILEPGETVEDVSLGAGNTGKAFDLETNFRVAEFKFIRWRGHDAVRQDSIFKDFVLLAESDSPKRKYLYSLGTEHALKFLKGGRSINSVLSRHEKVKSIFVERFGARYTTVRDYYRASSNLVDIVDVSRWLPELAGDLLIAKETDEAL